VELVEAIVVGAGVAGGATARALAERGVQTTLIEQFEVGHTRGSSHGPTRLFRLAYPQPDYVRLAVRALDAWRELEDAAGEELLVRNGGLYAGAWAEESALALDAAGVSHDWLEPAEAAERYPAMSFDGLDRVLRQEDGGTCLADRTVAAQVRLAREAGADVRERTEALRLLVTREGVEVETTAGELRAPVAVVTAGPYAAPLLAQAGVELPLEASFAQVTYFRALDGAEQPPGFVEAGGVDGGLAHGGYWVPSPDGSGAVKAGDGAAGATVDPREAPFEVDPEEERVVADFVRRRLPGYDPVPVRSETCIYTMTPDEDFVLDRRGPLVVGSPCSGHGFKFAPLLGRILADLVTGHDPGIPDGRFSLGRFRAIMNA
jgi:sarcosine oxidase